VAHQRRLACAVITGTEYRMVVVATHDTR